MGDELATSLRERGMRLTSQRRQVLAAVQELGHPTPERIADHLRSAGAQVSVTTVYRALDLLEGLGLVRHTHLGHGPPVYHAADEADHLHTVCHGCGKVEAIDVAALADVGRRLRSDSGFVLDATHVALSGRCADCAANGAPESGAAGMAADAGGVGPT